MEAILHWLMIWEREIWIARNAGGPASRDDKGCFVVPPRNDGGVLDAGAASRDDRRSKRNTYMLMCDVWMRLSSLIFWKKAESGEVVFMDYFLGLVMRL